MSTLLVEGAPSQKNKLNGVCIFLRGRGHKVTEDQHFVIKKYVAFKGWDLPLDRHVILAAEKIQEDFDSFARWHNRHVRAQRPTQKTVKSQILLYLCLLLMLSSQAQMQLTGFEYHVKYRTSKVKQTKLSYSIPSGANLIVVTYYSFIPRPIGLVSRKFRYTVRRVKRF